MRDISRITSKSQSGYSPIKRITRKSATLKGTLKRSLSKTVKLMKMKLDFKKLQKGGWSRRRSRVSWKRRRKEMKLRYSMSTIYLMLILILLPRIVHRYHKICSQRAILMWIFSKGFNHFSRLKLWLVKKGLFKKDLSQLASWMTGMKGRLLLRNWISIMKKIKLRKTDQNLIQLKKSPHSIKRRLTKVNAERMISIINSYNICCHPYPSFEYSPIVKKPS